MEKVPAVYWFDMDDTLIDNDCDVSWKDFVIAEGLADEEETRRLTQKYYEDYVAGTLDNDVFVLYQHREFAGRTIAAMAELAEKHFKRYVEKKIYPEALALCRRVIADGKPCAIITSTCTPVAAPVARYFGIQTVIGAELEIVDGRYTGRLTGTYPVKQGKVEYMERYCAAHNVTPADFAYYGDSINDSFLLQKVGFPHACNPSASLKKLAEEHHWPILNFTHPEA